MATDVTVCTGEEVTLRAVPRDVDKIEAKSAEPVTFSIRQGSATLSNQTATSVLLTPGKVEELVIVDVKAQMTPACPTPVDDFFAVHVIIPAVSVELSADKPVAAGSTAKIPAPAPAPTP